MRATRRGFTLIEILIVVIILGILAAIVIPQFGAAGEDARKANVKTQLQTIRSQVQLYKAQHGDQLPDLITSWDALTTTTTYGSKTLGPYMIQTPVNPLNNLSNIADGDGSAPAQVSAGFIYDYAGGAGSGKVYATGTDGFYVYEE